MNDRKYEKQKQNILKYIKRKGKIDFKEILNEVNINYDTLKRIVDELKSKGEIWYDYNQKFIQDYDFIVDLK